MNTVEKTFLIDCQASPMVAVLHQPENPLPRGILIVVAGGPQYRAGCARQLIYWARKLADQGYAVMRFDYRGLGDSAGDFLGFEQVDNDIESAIESFFSTVPELKELVLWGECNAASSNFQFAWRDERITGIIAQNPWVRDEGTQAKTYLKHYYLYRLGQKSFWLKLFGMKFNPVRSLRAMYGLWVKSKNIGSDETVTKQLHWDPRWSYQVKMREGLNYYSGKILLFMSGRSLIGKEFDELVSASERWKEVLESVDMKRIDNPNADHTYSRQCDKDQLISDVTMWLKGLDSK